MVLFFFLSLETTTEMISATDHTDDCFRYSFVSDMIRGELSECACCFPHGLLGSEIDIWVFIWVGGLGAVFFLEMSIKKIPFYFPTFSCFLWTLSALFVTLRTQLQLTNPTELEH